MSKDTTPNAANSIRAARDLREVESQIEQARDVLSHLRSDIVESLSRIESRPSAELVEANQELVLALLRVQDRDASHARARETARSSARNGPDGGVDREALREANGQLLQAALEAQDSRLVAEAAQRRQAEFLAVLAHELRGPLAPIRTAVALLGRVHTDEPELLACLRTVIERQVVHVSRMVADLLDMSRLQTGKMRLERQPLDLGKIVDEVADACRPAMAARQQQFSVARPTTALPMLGDSTRLTQVLHNLLENASKYTQNGGEIRLVVEAGDQALVVTVSDNGIGITPEALAHVFEPFVQDAHAVDYSNTGLGIGLALVKELVEAHGGSVVASSGGIGTGSQFTVTLPQSAETRSRGA